MELDKTSWAILACLQENARASFADIGRVVNLSAPAVAERMNNLPKFVFSRVLDNVSWNNTTLLKGDLALEVRKMKAESDGNIVILGSGSLVAQLAPEGLIDELMIVVNPIVLGNGRTIFEGVREKLPLTLTRSRVFANGNLLLCYEPVS